MHTKRYVIGLFFVFIFATSQVFADGARPRFAEALKPEEVRPFFESFLNQRLQGDYTFKFLLEHLPRRGRTVRYEAHHPGGQGPPLKRSLSIVICTTSNRAE